MEGMHMGGSFSEILWSFEVGEGFMCSVFHFLRWFSIS